MIYAYRLRLLCIMCLFSMSINSYALDIFHNGVNLITGTWTGNGDLEETSEGGPFNGSTHYRFIYDYDGFWAGFGLNMDNWGNSPAYDFSEYTHIYIAYKELNNNQTFRLQLRSGDNEGPSFDLGGMNTAYQVIKIPLILLSGGLDMTEITELIFSIGGDFPEGNGTVYVDAIYLTNEGISSIGSASWPLQQALGRGFNMTNWLEAYWLIPFDAFPEVDRYDRSHVEFLANAGMDHIRLPITFEHLTGPAPDYELDLNHIVFDLIDSAIQWAIDYNLLLIIDNHHGSVTLSNDNFETELPRIMAIWSQVIDLYGHLDPDQFLFELYNEPTSAISNNNLRVFFQQLIDDIRLKTSDHTLIIGGNGFNSGSGLTSFIPIENDQRLIYTFHSYEPYFFTHQGMSWTSPPFLPPTSFPEEGDVQMLEDLFSTVADWSAIYDLPVYMGEYGCAVSADDDSRCNYINLIMDLSNTYGFTHAYWDVFFDFGFADPDQLDGSQVVPCFAQAIGLNFIVLSIDVIKLDQDCYADHVELTWHMAPSTDDKDRFYLEYSSDAFTWKRLPIAQTGYREQAVSFTISKNLGPYIRLHQESESGDINKSPISILTCTEDAYVKVFPNPTNGPLYFQVDDTSIDGNFHLTIFDAYGRSVFHRTMDRYLSESIDLSHLSNGSYRLSIQGTDLNHQSTILVIK